MPWQNLWSDPGLCQEVFEYDERTDTYRCPAGEVLSRRKHKLTRKCFEYAAPTATCVACRLRSQCTRANGTARSIKRHYGQDAIEAARAQSHSTEARRDRARRQWLLEGSFADAANNHGFKRARWRRLWRQQIQDYLIATIQNVRILLRRGTETPKTGVRVTERIRKSMTCVFGPGCVHTFSIN